MFSKFSCKHIRSNLENFNCLAKRVAEGLSKILKNSKVSKSGGKGGRWGGGGGACSIQSKVVEHTLVASFSTLLILASTVKMYRKVEKC